MGQELVVETVVMLWLTGNSHRAFLDFTEGPRETLRLPDSSLCTPFAFAKVGLYSMTALELQWSSTSRLVVTEGPLRAQYRDD